MEYLPLSEALPYLFQTIAYNNSDWLAVYQNLQKSRRQWVMVARVMERTGATVRDRGAMYKSVAQSVLFYRSKRWVVTGEMPNVLEGFHHLLRVSSSAP